MAPAVRAQRVCRIPWTVLAILLVAGWSARAGAAPALKAAEVPAAVEARAFSTLQEWVHEFAEKEGWSTAPRRLKSYWHAERTLKDARWGTFLLGYMARSGDPRGGERTWMLLYESPAGLRAIGPVATQAPYSNTSEQKVLPGNLSLKGEKTAPSGLLWVELAEELSQYVEEVDDFRKTLTRLGFAFRVGADGTLVCVAYEVPLTITTTLQGKQKSRSSLKVSFPMPGVMRVEPGSGQLSTPQSGWVGEYDVSGDASEGAGRE